MISVGETKFILRRTFNRIFCLQNLLTKKKVFHGLEVAFSVKTRAKTTKKSLRHPGVARLLQAQGHYRLVISKPDTNAGRKTDEDWRKKFALVAKFFAVTCTRLNWLEIFVERVNREEKSHADWTNRRILEQMNHEEKDKLLVSSLLIWCHYATR